MDLFQLFSRENHGLGPVAQPGFFAGRPPKPAVKRVYTRGNHPRGAQALTISPECQKTVALSEQKRCVLTHT